MADWQREALEQAQGVIHDQSRDPAAQQCARDRAAMISRQIDATKED